MIKKTVPYSLLVGDALPGWTGNGGDRSVDRFDDSRDRVLAALAAVEAAERACLSAAAAQVGVLADEAGLGPGQLLIFHAIPRGDAVRRLDSYDWSREDAVLQAVDLADVAGRRLRLTPAGLGPFSEDVSLPEPVGASYEPCASCTPSGVCARASSEPFERVVPTPPPAPRLGNRFWQRAVLTWVDLHRALATWTGRRLAATLVVAPETGDVASLEPLYCPDRGQDFEVVTSLRLASAPTATGDLDAALAGVLDEYGSDGVDPDQVELDLRRWLAGVGFPLPGFPAHGPDECDPLDGPC